MSIEILEAVYELERQKSIDAEILLSALEEALRAAWKKTPGAAEHVRVEIDRETGEIRVLQVTVPDEELVARGVLHLPEPEEVDESAEPDANAISPEALAVRKSFEPQPLIEEPEANLEWDRLNPEDIETVDATNAEFGRIAAQTAKQVILQRIREAEREMMYEEYQDRVGDLVTGIVQQSDSRYCLVDLGKVEALLPGSEQVGGERYEHGARIKAVIIDVRSGTKGPQIILSRRSDELIKSLFELEVPEIADGLVVIRSVARDPGYRAKIAVESRTQGVDPVGACVGPRGSRVRMVVSELRGEKIDIIPWNDEPARFVAKALSPARVREVLVDDAERQATVLVPEDQLSLAIGREGQNAKLAAKLTGWRIDIKSEAEYLADAEDAEVGGETIGAVLKDRDDLAELLEQGRVTINGIVARSLDKAVGPDDVVSVDGEQV